MSSSLGRFLAKEPKRETTRALRGLYDETLDPPAAAALYFKVVYTAVSWDKAKVQFLPGILKGQEVILKWSEYPQLDSYGLILWRDKNFSYNDNKDYINETAFIAKLSARRIPHADFLKESNFSVFENDTIEKAARGDNEALHELQSEVPHSAQWIFYAGKTIFEAIYTDEPERSEPWNWTGKQPLAKNEFTRVRWDAWKKGAKEVTELPKVNKETKEIAQKMLAKMGSIEQVASVAGRDEV
ncbi:hypothetical protein N431DRAFT_518814 [Stipitochalara longipes BDJ]|nr:hypothetical protein N431DRAFT_518814 [Stipitochalara longipes BDJ]